MATDGSSDFSYDVFISYAEEDRWIGQAIAATLESQRIHSWIAPRDIFPGTNFAQSILNAVSRCRAFVLVFSSHAQRSRWKQERVQCRERSPGDSEALPEQRDPL